jgi:hypothetical protein
MNSHAFPAKAAQAVGRAVAAALIVINMEMGTQSITVPTMNQRIDESACLFRLLELFSCMQRFAKDFSSPVRYCLSDFAQIAPGKLCDYTEATTMNNVVVDNQLIGAFEHSP